MQREEEEPNNKNKIINEGKDDGNTKKQQQRRRRRPIEKVNYDGLNRTCNKEDDENWEIANPVDKTTGLWYDPNKYTNSSSNCADWADLIPKYLQHGYESSLGMKDLSAAPLLMIERSYNPPPLRQQMLEILMEECQVPATFFGRDATLACYANAKTTSTVIDIGYSGTTVTPVFDGYVEQKGIRRSPIGSLAMDELALEHLKSICTSSRIGHLKPLYQVRKPNIVQRSDPFHRLALLSIAQDCRESGAGQSINTAASKSLQVPSIAFTLPDGQTVDVPSQNRFAVADYIIGKATPSEEDNSAVDADPREVAITTAKNDWNSIIVAATKEDAANDDDEYDDDDEDMDDGEVEQSKRQAEKYTEATAVGVSSRRTTRRQEAKQQAKADAAAAAASSSLSAANNKSKVQFNNRVLQHACSSYFTTQLDYLTTSPIAGMVCDAAFRCDRDQQASVLGNAVLCGGGACIGPTDQAVPDLLREQIEGIIHTHTPGWRVKVLSPAMQERSICSWLGGSILGSLGTFHEMWITKADYEEWGSSIVNRKCP